MTSDVVLDVYKIVRYSYGMSVNDRLSILPGRAAMYPGRSLRRGVKVRAPVDPGAFSHHACEVKRAIGATSPRGR